MSAVVVDGDLITAYGLGEDACWEGLTAGQSAVKPLSRFSTSAFSCHCAATIDGLTYRSGPSVVWQMLCQLLSSNDSRIPEGAPVLLATTTGEIDLLEQSVDAGTPLKSISPLSALLHKVLDRLAGTREGSLVSSACASATVALAQGAGMIERDECDCVLVVACDAVSEFVYSGFASLMALDAQQARPFDADRKGLNLGEAAGFILLMSDARAARENRPILGELSGWGMSNDANHMTGPSRDGGALARAIETALICANCPAEDVAMICAHGTGTLYNDSMELKAFKTVFPVPKPTFSVKGGTGHTMGAAGLLEVFMTLRALRERLVPQTVSLEHPADDAIGWVTSRAVSLDVSPWSLTTNSGFGGVNAALVLRGAVQ